MRLKYTFFLLISVFFVGCSIEKNNIIDDSHQTETKKQKEVMININDDIFICEDGKYFVSTMANVDLKNKKTYEFIGRLSIEVLEAFDKVFDGYSVNFKDDYKPQPDILGEHQVCNIIYNKEAKNKKIDYEKCQKGVKTIYQGSVSPIFGYVEIEEIDKKHFENINLPMPLEEHIIYQKFSDEILAELFDITSTVIFPRMQYHRILLIDEVNQDLVKDVYKEGEITKFYKFKEKKIRVTLYKKIIMVDEADDLCKLNLSDKGFLISEITKDSDGDRVFDEIELILKRNPFNAEDNRLFYKNF